MLASCSHSSDFPVNSLNSQSADLNNARLAIISKNSTVNTKSITSTVIKSQHSITQHSTAQHTIAQQCIPLCST
ncbi:hypothetical protein E2C01_080565 [Portunus trituberculatus]|uniref:Uncharacterized protein n=1 Tax=Portunus trituberculatus TaxID=210409 RepID=A0A5B7ITS9_PORTR|nr:hypothetical protein [Portunus trituberculatus]